MSPDQLKTWIADEQAIAAQLERTTTEYPPMGSMLATRIALHQQRALFLEQVLEGTNRA